MRQRRKGTEWRDGNGRPRKKQSVYDWLDEHPFGKKIECERDTGLSRHTVLKWWDECKREVFHQMDEKTLDFCMESKYTKEDVAQMIKEAEEMCASDDEQIEKKVSD